MLPLAFLFGCGASYSVPPEDHHLAKQATAGNQYKSQNLVSFKVNGAGVKAKIWSLTRFGWKNNIAGILLNITSNMHDDKRSIDINLDAAVPGKYSLEQGTTLNNKSGGSYNPDYISDQANNLSFINGVFELTEVDTVENRVNGCFYGKVKNKKAIPLK